MSLFLSQIEPEIKHELYRRIGLSSHGYEAVQGKILDPIKSDSDRHWYSRRKPWIRLTSGGLTKIDTGNIHNNQYSEKDAVENVLFGGILNVEAIKKGDKESTQETGEKIGLVDYRRLGLRSGFENVYTGIRKTPTAGIISVTVKNKGDLGSIREAEIKWTCWDEDKFNKLQRLYMTPGISCLLEWGWSIDSTGAPVSTNSPFFDLKVSPDKLETKAEENPYGHGNIKQRVIDSNGCYDACVGMVNNFDWTFNKDTGAYDCTTKLTAPGDSLLGMELGGTDPDASINITGAYKMNEWFTPKTFQAYVSGKGLRLERTGLDIKEINLYTDIKKLGESMPTNTLAADLGTVSWVGTMLNCTKPSGATKAESSTLGRQERKIRMEGKPPQTFTYKVGSRIRVMEYPEISRFNGWSQYTRTGAPGEQAFVTKMINNPRLSGAFFFDDWGWKGNTSFVTWAFFEEILINQFFAPIVSPANQTPNPADIMILRSCNVLELTNKEVKKKMDYYTNIAINNAWMKKPAKEKTLEDVYSIFYESVRIGHNKHLRSVDGGVMWIPGQPPPPKDSSITDDLDNAYDKFLCGDHSGQLKGKDQEEGYLRNVMINVEAIKASFINANTIEDGLSTLLGKMNSAACDYWNLTVQCDENEGGTKLKVIDSNWVEKSVSDIKSKEGSSSEPLIEDTTFRFPIYSNNSISSGVNMSSQLPDSLKAAVFVGGNKYRKDRWKSNEEQLPVFTEDVIDRYHHFGPYTKEGQDQDAKDEATAQREFAAQKEKDAIDDANTNLAKQKMTGKVQGETTAYVKSLLYTNTDPHNQYRNNRMLPVNLSLDIDGISGIYFGNTFTISKLPKSLDNRLLFQVKNVTHTVNNDMWATAIESICRIGEETEGDLKAQEHWINQKREESKLNSENKHAVSEKQRKEKEKKLSNAEIVQKSEQDQGGKETKGGNQNSQEAKEYNADDTDLHSTINLDATTTEAGSKDSSKTRKSGKDTHIILPVKKEIVVVSEDKLTPAEKRELEKEEKAKAKHVYINTAWFTNSELPGGLSSVDGLGTENKTYWSENDNYTHLFKIGNTWDDHTKDRQEFMLSTHTAAYRFSGSTGDLEMRLIHDEMVKYKQEGLLLMWLQAFHLWSICPTFKDWKEDNGFNGNIFKWINYEKPIAKAAKSSMMGGSTPAALGIEAFEKVLGWNAPTRTDINKKEPGATNEPALYGTLGGIQFHELSTDKPVGSVSKGHFSGRSASLLNPGAGGNPGIFIYPTDSGEIGETELDDSNHQYDPRFYPWGPQWANERGFYYIESEPGAEEPIYSDQI
jgi:hypothetical protein